MWLRHVVPDWPNPRGLLQNRNSGLPSPGAIHGLLISRLQVWLLEPRNHSLQSGHGSNAIWGHEKAGPDKNTKEVAQIHSEALESLLAWGAFADAGPAAQGSSEEDAAGRYLEPFMVWPGPRSSKRWRENQAWYSFPQEKATYLIKGVGRNYQFSLKLLSFLSLWNSKLFIRSCLEVLFDSAVFWGCFGKVGIARWIQSPLPPHHTYRLWSQFSTVAQNF